MASSPARSIPWFRRGSTTSSPTWVQDCSPQSRRSSRGHVPIETRSASRDATTTSESPTHGEPVSADLERGDHPHLVAPSRLPAAQALVELVRNAAVAGLVAGLLA